MRRSAQSKHLPMLNTPFFPDLAVNPHFNIWLYVLKHINCSQILQFSGIIGRYFHCATNTHSPFYRNFASWFAANYRIGNFCCTQKMLRKLAPMTQRQTEQ